MFWKKPSFLFMIYQGWAATRFMTWKLSTVTPFQISNCIWKWAQLANVLWPVIRLFSWMSKCKFEWCDDGDGGAAKFHYSKLKTNQLFLSIFIFQTKYKQTFFKISCSSIKNWICIWGPISAGAVVEWWRWRTGLNDY